MKSAGVILATVVALTLQTVVVGRFPIRGTVVVDLVLVVVVYTALLFGPVTGLLTGTLAGLVQDYLTTGVVGIGALAKTVVGFIAGAIGTQFIVAQPLPRFVVFFGASLVHALIFIGLYVLLGLRSLEVPYATVLWPAAANAVVGVIAFQIAELLPGAVERRRMARPTRRR